MRACPWCSVMIRRQLGEFGNLMPGRLWVAGPGSAGKGAWQWVQIVGT